MNTNEYTLLVTDADDNRSIKEHLALRYGESIPQYFFKLEYAPPYNEFNGINKYRLGGNTCLSEMSQ